MKPPTPRGYINRMDTARKFPVNTCGSTRSLQIIAEQLAESGHSSTVEEFPEDVAVQIALVVEELWAARSMLRELGYEPYVKSTYGMTRYRKATA